MLQSPAADGGAVDGKVVSTEHFGGSEAVGAGRPGGEELAQGGQHQCRQRLALVTARKGRTPVLGTALRPGGEIGTGEFVEAGAAQTELGARLSAGEFFGAEAEEHIADKRSGLTGVEAGVFIRGR